MPSDRSILSLLMFVLLFRSHLICEIMLPVKSIYFHNFVKISTSRDSARLVKQDHFRRPVHRPIAGSSGAYSNFLLRRQKTVKVTIPAVKSAIGSAKNSPRTPRPNKCGRISAMRNRRPGIGSVPSLLFLLAMAFIKMIHFFAFQNL